MSTIATCGHKLMAQEGLGTTIATKDYTKDGTKVIGYPTLCNSCLQRYKKEGLELKTKKEQKEWLNTK